MMEGRPRAAMNFPLEEGTNLRSGNLPKRRLADFRIRQVPQKGIRAVWRTFTFLGFCGAVRGPHERDSAYGLPRFLPAKASQL